MCNPVLINITSFTCSHSDSKLYVAVCEIWEKPIIIAHIWVTLCHDHYCPMKIMTRRQWKHYDLKLNCFLYFKWSDWSKKVLTCTCQIIKYMYSWHRVICMWLIHNVCFFFRSATPWCISKMEKKRDVILIILDN